jgi:DNA-binding MarR family transcriptional regulator
LYPTKPMATPRPNSFDIDDPVNREVALRIGRSWRDLRRGASMSALVDYFFGVGDDALESGQMDTLDVLVQQPAWRMGDLADALRVDPSTATRAVQRLERVGLATRCVNPSDRRVVMVSATDHGRDRHSEAIVRRQSVMRSIMSAYNAQEREQLAVYLERFVEALDSFVDGLDRPQ